ncbi:MAG: flagellar motor protein [Symploca sp. SIO3C6]|nr:flagellar motor protein [Symploca sp. SIO3C6]
MNSKQLKYAEIFSFIAFVFFVVLIFYQQTNQRLQGELVEAKTKHKFPPNITIQNTGKYAFKLGQANLTPQLEQFIHDTVVPKIKERFKNYKVNIIEVIGHTDGVEFKGISNLDKRLNVVAGNENRRIGSLKAGSNTDLGLMRALAIIKALQKEEEMIQFFKEKGLGNKPMFRAYSAAQLYNTDGTIATSSAKENPSRRRIEIRFTYHEEN